MNKPREESRTSRRLKVRKTVAAELYSREQEIGREFRISLRGKLFGRIIIVGTTI